MFLFGTARVGEFLEKGFTFISIGNDLHHVLTQAGAYVKDMESIVGEQGQGVEAAADGAAVGAAGHSHRQSLRANSEGTRHENDFGGTGTAIALTLLGRRVIWTR